MTLLLKITEGLMAGAEATLTPGTRIKLGSAEECDIILPDNTIPELVCELDIGEDTVAIIMSDGSSEKLPLYTVRSFSFFAFAVGPADSPWEELRKPVPAHDDSAEQDGETDTEQDSNTDKPDATDIAADNSLKSEDTDHTQPTRKKYFLFFILGITAIILLVVSLIFGGKSQKNAPPPKVETEPIPLEEIARNYNLQYYDGGEIKMLRGNLKLRTERLAVSALARDSYSGVRLKLTDDQTLQSASQALLFTLTEGRITSERVENCIVYLTGDEIQPNEYAVIQEAFKNDLPAIIKLDYSYFINKRMAEEEAAAEAARRAAAAEAAVLASDVEKGKSGSPEEGKDSSDAEQAKDNAGNQSTKDENVVASADLDTHSKRALDSMDPHSSNKPQAQEINYPIAGILTVPYPCVVMNNGVRCMTGAQLGKYTIIKIESDCLTLSDGRRSIKWRPLN